MCFFRTVININGCIFGELKKIKVFMDECEFMICFNYNHQMVFISQTSSDRTFTAPP